MEPDSVVSYFDDGTSLITQGGATVAGGSYTDGPPADYAMMVANTGSSGTGAFDIFDKFTGLITKGAGVYLGLQSQADTLRNQQAARDAAKYQQDAALSIARLNANNAVQLAALKNQSTALLASPKMLLVLAAGAVLIYVMHKRG